MLRLLSLLLTTSVVFLSSVVSGQEQDRKGHEFFEKKIRPVLVQQCFECHSQKSKELGGKLRLDTKAGLLTGGESGPAVVPGKPKESLLLKALRYDGLEMPPKKRLSESVAEDFSKWIQMGAPDPRTDSPEPKPEQVAGEPGIDLEEGRKFWSFQPLAKVSAPKVKDAKWSRTDLDRFVLAKLEEAKLKPAPDADTRTLVRRLYYDLIGLPPTPEQVEEFQKSYKTHGSHKSYSALIDQLLDSPHFGERWARHWLDVARYGESNGNVRNATFPHAWRYRDYVIRAFNEDKPYDRFVTEQVAGDLLPHASLTERDSNLIATGFLAVGSKPNANGNANFQMDVVADQIEVVTTSVLALTVACARCHDHKYDPVPTRDYYSLAGIFTSTETLYGATGNTMGGAPPTALIALSKDGKTPAEPIQDEKDDEKDGGKKGKKNGNGKKGGGAGIPKYPAGTPLAMGARDRSQPADCRINVKGETKQLGASVPRGFVQVCTTGSAPEIPADQSGRLELAQWMTNPENPLTSRVVVNRIWHHLFGQGLVKTPDNFGLHGERPTHPELLDHLAQKFMADGWSFKNMIRTIVLSRTYQMSSQYDEKAFTSDPDNNLLWRHTRRRLDAEAFRDSVLAVSGELDTQPGEGSLLAKLGEVLIQDKLTPDKIQKPSNHRSVYLCLLRSGEPEELLIFDLADPSLIVGARNLTTVPAQALFLMNSPFVVEQSQHFADRLLAAKFPSVEDELSQRIHLAYQLTCQRRATAAELTRAREYLQTAATVPTTTQKPDNNKQQRVDWAGFCQSLFATNEFRFFD